SQGGIEVGFHAKEAQLIASQTALGAAALLLKSDNHPEHEIDKVTTPKGCTIAGLNEMEHNGLSSALIKGIKLSCDMIEKIRLAGYTSSPAKSAFTYSLRISAMAELEIPLGQTASHSAKFEQSPNPSFSICSTIATVRCLRSGSPC